MTIIYIILAIALAIGVCLISAYNGLVRLNQRVKQAWSGITIQLKYRADLLPNLVETVKGYAKHEKELFTLVTEARSASMGANTPKAASEAERKAQAVMTQILAVAENYPDLKANDSFTKLQDELSDIENKIQAARRAYNNGVEELNSKVMSFPVVLFGGFGFKSQEYFNVSEEERTEIEKPVEVKF